MDRELCQRLAAGTSPFDGVTLAPGSMLPVDDLAEALRSALRVLRPRGQGKLLYLLRDRHESDGADTPSEVVPWSWLDALTASGEALYRARTGETLVSLGLYHAEPSFYLRAYIMNEDEDETYPGRWGDFDLSGPPALIAEVRRQLDGVPATLEERRSSDYFRDRAAG